MRVHRSKEILRCILGYSYIIILLLIPLSDNVELNSPLFVIGSVSQDVILPCHVNFKTQVKLKEIQWNKKVNRTIQNIYRFTASIGEAIYGQDYKARAVISEEGLNTRDVSLKLEKVQMSDEGSYSCFVKSADDWIDQVQIVLHVENSKGNSSTSSSLNWMLPFFFITIILFLVLIAALFYCKRKEKKRKTQMRDLKNNTNLLQGDRAEEKEQPQENRVLLSPFKIQDTQNQLENLQEENKTLTKEHETLTKEHETLKKEHETLKKEHETLKKEHETLTKEHETLKKEHETLKKEHGNRAEEKENQKEEKGLQTQKAAAAEPLECQSQEVSNRNHQLDQTQAPL